MAKESIIFFGSGPVASDSLKALAKYFDIEAVITKPKPPHHRGIAPVEELSQKLSLRLYFANSKSEIEKIFTKGFHSRLGVVVDFGVIISEKIINYFDLGIINSHFSLLPEWRGADPITYSILSGQSKTGVSLMLIEPTLDTGKLIAQKTIQIEANETTMSLTAKLINLSNDMLANYLPKYINGDIKKRAQPHPNRATYSKKITKSDGLIDWTKPAVQIEREIRAYSGWPKSYVKLFDKNIIVTKAHVEKSAINDLAIKCGDNNYLSIDELIAPSGRKMSATDFLNGCANR